MTTPSTPGRRRVALPTTATAEAPRDPTALAVASSIVPSADGEAPRHVPAARPALTRAPSSAQLHAREGDKQSKPEPEWMGNGPWGVVVTDFDQLNVEETYRRLRDGLSLGSNALNYGVLAEALDLAERNLFDAGRLARAAKLEQERIDLACDEELEVLRSAARDDLEREKVAKKVEAKGGSAKPAEQEGEPGQGEQEQATGGRKKAATKPEAAGRITIQEVEDRMMRAWAPDVKKLKLRKARAHAVRGTCDKLEEAWGSRCATLRLLTEKVRRVVD